MQAMLRDVIVAVRRIRTRPVVSVAAIVTLALGIGANVAIFSVAWPVLVAPLPFPDEDRLMLVSLTYQRGDGRARNYASVGDYNDIRTAASFASMAAFNKYTQQLNLTGRGEPEPLEVGAVTAEFFQTLGVRPLVGRLLQGQDAQSSGRLLVLSERTWRERFDADPAIGGTVLRLDGEAYEVIGVAPASAGLGTVDPEAWMQQGIDPTSRQRGSYFLGVVGRLRSDTSIQVANQQLAGIMQRAALEFPQFNRMLSADAEAFRDLTTAPVRSTMVLLLMSAGMVLVVALVNLIGLQMARHLERLKELSVRRALGASAWQVARQLLMENVVLAWLGGLVGAAVAVITLRMLESIAPTFGWHHLAPVSRLTVITFGVGLTLVAGLFVGALPAWRAGFASGHGDLQTRSVTAGRWGTRLRSVVIGAQVAATAVLLIVAALITQSQMAVLAVDPGFDFDHAVAADVNVPRDRYATIPQLTQFFDRLNERVRAIPGVVQSCLTNEVPLDRGPGNMTYVVEGETRLVSALPTTITEECPALLRVPLVRGRWFTPADTTPSVVVSAAMAAALWPDRREPIGQRIHLGLPSGVLLTVVGVAGDLRVDTLEGPPSPVVWMPQAIGYFPPKHLLVRFAGGASGDPAPLRTALKDVDPDVALGRVRSLDDIVAHATSPRRFALFLLSAFAVTAVVLCAVGIYSLLAHLVGQRTQEIGIRVALGARPGTVARLVVMQMMVAVTVGVCAGVWGARAMSAPVSTLLFGVTATEPRVYVAVVAGVVVMAALAAWLPTRRALRIEPVIALRSE
jgi:predicted permease